MEINLSLSRFKRFHLLEGPTPIQRLTRLEKQLGTDTRLYVKRDDLMGVGLGGNKLRKLEFLIGDALEQGCSTFITTGGLQSNHARLSAAAAARAGLECELVLASMVDRDDDAYLHNGNLLLDDLFGAVVHRASGKTNPLEIAQERARALAKSGKKAYVVGLGGSTPLGSLGYVACASELAEQEREIGTQFSRIVVPTGSFGTHAGLLTGLQMLGENADRVQAFTVLSKADEAMNHTEDLIRSIHELLSLDDVVDHRMIRIDDSQLGAGYGCPTQPMIDAVRLLARTEGLVLDPVYSGKAFAGFIDMVRAGVAGSGESMVFIMTGGSPGLFAYPTAFEK